MRVQNRLTSGIRGWFGKPRATQGVVPLDIAPERSFFAVGDIHGCPDLMDQITRKLEEVSEGQEQVVFVGDYVDRGAGSCKVLGWLFEVQQMHPGQAICLMGNHERMMLDFIDDPAGRGARWLRNGGLDTLASFGVQLRRADTDTDVAVEVANALEAAMPAGLQDWLRTLPLRWSSGNVHCVHAALSPRRAPDDQRDEVLLWGHPDFMTTPRDDGQFVVHGHTIVGQAGVTDGRIAIDTGAYRTGRLSAVRIAAGECRFLTT
jgi:serine/threonine protein phosphatase 1